MGSYWRLDFVDEEELEDLDAMIEAVRDVDDDEDRLVEVQTRFRPRPCCGPSFVSAAKRVLFFWN